MAKVIGKLARSHGYFNGPGYVAGFAPGLVTVNTAPASREVELRHRASRIVVARTFSAADGTYLFHGVSPDEQFDVLARDWTNTYNDVIVTRVAAVPYAITLTGALSANDSDNTITGAVAIAGGLHALGVTVASGTAPTGVTFSITGRVLSATGTAANGSYSWTLRVAASNGRYTDLACTAVFT